MNKVKYTPEQVKMAYDLWRANAYESAVDPVSIDRRRATWENYCDYRDGLPPGTTAALDTKPPKKYQPKADKAPIYVSDAFVGAMA